MRRYTRGFAQFRGAAINSSALSLPKPGAQPVSWVIGAVNALMRRQPAAQELLAQHAGRTVHIHIGQPRFALTVCHDGSLDVADDSIMPDVTLRVDVTRLLQSGWTPGRALPESAGLFHITGDAALAQSLSTLARHWRPDLEDLLAEFVGDIPAVQIVRTARGFLHALFETGEKLTQNVAEFLAYESRDLTARPVLETWQRQLQSHTRSLSEMDQRLEVLFNRLRAIEAGRPSRRVQSAGREEGV